MITRDIQIEDLVDQYPFSVSYLSKKGIRCIVCGEPIWGTLEEACIEKGYSPEAIDEVLIELNEMKDAELKGRNSNGKRIDIDKLDV